MKQEIFDRTTYNAMVATLAKPGEVIISQLTPQRAHMWHMATGIMGEATELLTAYENRDRANMLEEMGDGEFYFEGLCQAISTFIPAQIPALPNNLWDGVGACATALVVAAGEILDISKKIIIYNDDSRINALKSEMQVYRRRLDALYQLTGINQEEALLHNEQKLTKGSKARYKDGVYSDEAAQKRADKQE